MAECGLSQYAIQSLNVTEYYNISLSNQDFEEATCNLWGKCISSVSQPKKLIT